jgi:hypothetical protein
VNEWLRSGEWITPFIHAWALVVLVLAVVVFITHRRALLELAQRIGHVAGLVEGKPSAPVSPEKMGGLLLYLGDLIHKMDPDAITPILQYIRREEKAKTLQVHQTLVHVTETMIELFPMLGIFGTVWGFSGISEKDFSSQALLSQFAVAVETTLYGLIYFIIFRLFYAGLIQAKVAALGQHSLQFQEFLSALERRSSEGSAVPDEEGTGFWEGKGK